MKRILLALILGLGLAIPAVPQNPLVPLVQEVHPDDVVQIIPRAIPRADSVFATIQQITAGGFGPIPNNTVLGNVSGLPAPPVPLNTTQHTTLVNTFTTNLSGAVPAPLAINNFFLRDDGTFAPAGGSGTVTSVVIAASTPITVSGTCTITTTGTCTIGVLTASQTDWLGNVANRVLTPNAVWAGAAIFSLGTVSSGSVTPNFCAYGNATVTLAADTLTLANPSCIREGQTFSLYLVQDATGARGFTTFGSYYLFTDGTFPGLSGTANAFDMLQCTTRAGGTTGVCILINNPQAVP